jgi:hypothetical protein
MKKHKIDVAGIEKRILSKKHFYSGTLDVVGEIDGKFGILDIKTSKEIWDDNFIQLSAYSEAYNEKAFKKAKTYWVLRVDQYQECKLCGAKKRQKSGEDDISGKNKKCVHKWDKTKGVCELKEVSNSEVYLENFLRAKKLWEFSNRNWLSEIPNYPGKNFL